MKVLVTGTSRPLAQELIDALRAQGHELFLVGPRSGLRGGHGVLVQEDVLNLHHVDSKIDQVYHLDLDWDESHPVEAMLKNSIGTLNVLRLAYVKRARSVIGIDYAALYGKGETASAAAASIAFIEALSASYAQEKGLDARVARFYCVYGSSHGWLYESLKSILAGEDLSVEGGDVFPVHIRDAVDALMKLMTYEGSEAPGRAVDFPGQKIGREELVKTARKMLASNSRISQDKGKPTSYRPDPRFAYENLGWRPSVELQQGISELVELVKRSGERKRRLEKAQRANNKLQALPKACRLQRRGSQDQEKGVCELDVLGKAVARLWR
ncbi:NAD-dependent epimerase/dehydratase family protein [Tardisphaera miroshnichenkoae]